jgi:hypothetical protein
MSAPRWTNRAGYSDDFTRQREAEQAAAERQRQADAAENQAARDAYLGRVAAERETQRAAAEALVDADLAAERTRLERQWLADHPDRTAADFRTHAWPQLRANLVEQRAAETLERNKQQLRRASRVGYSL